MLNLSHIVDPISPEQPCGRDLHADVSFDSLYAQIKEERFSARRSEREQSESSPKAHWKKVYECGLLILTEQSKDLQVCCWVIEAAVRLYGFEGLLATLDVTKQLVESYWDQLYPALDEESFDARIAGFIGLNGDSTEGTLIFPLLNVSLTDGKSVPMAATWQFQYRDHVAKFAQNESKSDGTNTTSADALATSVHETSPDFFKALFVTLNQCLVALDQLDHALTDRCGHQAPSFSDIRKTLMACLTCLKTIAPFVVGSDDLTDAATEDVLGDENQSPTGSNGPLTRENAFKRLLDISTFFQQSEPHSPVPYLLRKAVRWGNMPLADLLRELVEDTTVLAHIYNLTGMDDTQNTNV